MLNARSTRTLFGLFIFKVTKRLLFLCFNLETEAIFYTITSRGPNAKWGERVSVHSSVHVVFPPRPLCFCSVNFAGKAFCIFVQEP